MHRANGRRVEVIQDEVTVGDRVDRVRRHAVESERLGDHPAVGVEVHAGQRARPQREVRGLIRREAKARAIAIEHPHVRQQVVREVDRLRALQVRVARQRPVGVAIGRVDQHGHQRLDLRDGAERRRAREQRHIGRHLVVARPRRVELAADGPGDLRQPPFDGHVDVLVVWRERERPVRKLALDSVEARQERVAIVVGDDPARREHRRVGARLRDVLRPKALVERQRGVHPLERGILGLAEAAHPPEPSRR